jgi:hypothetical protein
MFGDIREPVLLSRRDVDHGARTDVERILVSDHPPPSAHYDVDLILGVRSLVVEATDRNRVRPNAHVRDAQVFFVVVGLSPRGCEASGGLQYLHDNALHPDRNTDPSALGHDIRD